MMSWSCFFWDSCNITWFLKRTKKNSIFLTRSSSLNWESKTQRWLNLRTWIATIISVKASIIARQEIIMEEVMAQVWLEPTGVLRIKNQLLHMVSPASNDGPRKWIFSVKNSSWFQFARITTGLLPLYATQKKLKNRCKTLHWKNKRNLKEQLKSNHQITGIRLNFILS